MIAGAIPQSNLFMLWNYYYCTKTWQQILTICLACLWALLVWGYSDPQLASLQKWGSGFVFRRWEEKNLNEMFRLKFLLINLWGSFYQHGLTLISAWIRNHMPSKVWDEIIYALPNFSTCVIFNWNSIPRVISLCYFDQRVKKQKQILYTHKYAYTYICVYVYVCV